MRIETRLLALLMTAVALNLSAQDPGPFSESGVPRGNVLEQRQQFVIENEDMYQELLEGVETLSPEEYKAFWNWMNELKPREFGESDSQIRRLRIDCYNFAWANLKLCLQASQFGRGTSEAALNAFERVVEATLALETDPIRRIAELEKIVKAKMLAFQSTTARWKGNQVAQQDVFRAAFELRRTQIALLEAKEEAEAKDLGK